MDWGKLLTTKRYWVEERDRDLDGGERAFVDDAERIIYSSPFRRLQGKTQVHPLPRYDYLRTRLTHSVEVAHSGRYIAIECARRSGLDDTQQRAVGDIVYAACLAHDVGNPPFGHIGEYAIQTWFKTSTLPTVEQVMAKDDARAKDFLCFDGNAQGFRILTRLSGLRAAGGLQLTYATIGAMMKYPFGSLDAPSKKPKYGYMQADLEAARKVCGALGLIEKRSPDGKAISWCRHPLAYIVEAADDICYLTTDIEDSFRVKMLEFEEAEGTLRDIAEIGGHLDDYPKLRNEGEQDRIAFLRSRAVRSMTDGVIAAWQDSQSLIMEGNGPKDLIGASSYRANGENIRDLCEKKIYKEPKKLQLEAAGYHMIHQLFDIFGNMIDELLTTKDAQSLNARNQGLFQLLPEEYRRRLSHSDAYTSYLVLVDYISGMTDRFVLDLFQRLTGSSVSLGHMA